MFRHQDEGAHRETENDSQKPTDASSMAASPYGSHVCALHWSPGLYLPVLSPCVSLLCEPGGTGRRRTETCTNRTDWASRAAHSPPTYLIKKWIVPSLDSCSVCLTTDVDFHHGPYVVAT